MPGTSFDASAIINGVFNSARLGSGTANATSVLFGDSTYKSGATARAALGLSTGDVVIGETPSGLIDNSNTTYTTAHDFIPESVELFINGIRQKRIIHFTTIGTTIVLVSDSPLTSDFLQLNYERD